MRPFYKLHMLRFLCNVIKVERHFNSSLWYNNKKVIYPYDLKYFILFIFQSSNHQPCFYLLLKSFITDFCVLRHKLIHSKFQFLRTIMMVYLKKCSICRIHHQSSILNNITVTYINSFNFDFVFFTFYLKNMYLIIDSYMDMQIKFQFISWYLILKQKLYFRI